jgi:hypothetical protein
MCRQFPRSNSVPQRLTALGKPLVVPCYTPPGIDFNGAAALGLSLENLLAALGVAETRGRR